MSVIALDMHITYDEWRDKQAMITAFGGKEGNLYVPLGPGTIIHASATAVQLLADKVPPAGAQLEITIECQGGGHLCRFWGAVSEIAFSADIRRYFLEISVLPDTSRIEYQPHLH